MKVVMQRLGAFFIGFIVFLILLEAGLRIVGVVYQLDLLSANKSSASFQKNPYTILCLGNSFTRGEGVPKGKSYPDDLQVLLDGKFKKGKIRVINYGHDTENSSMLLESLESSIRKTEPDLILLQTGQPNWWNYYKYDDYLKRKHANPGEARFFTNNFLCRSRVYKLFVLLYDDIINKKDVEPDHDVCNAPGSNVDEIISCFKEQVTLHPYKPENYDALGRIYFRQKKNLGEAAEWFMWGISGEGRESFTQSHPIYVKMHLLRKELDKRNDREAEKIREKMDRFIEDRKKINAKSAYMFMHLTDEEVNRWVESDIKDIVSIIRSKNIKLILQNYPFDPLRAGSFNVDSTLGDLARDLNVPFVDHSMIFKKMLDAGAKRDDYWGVTHCNIAGYEVMAKNVYDKILEENILE